MGKHFVIIGATGKKSGGAFAKELSENLDKVRSGAYGEVSYGVDGDS